MNKKGFTLTELIGVIAILALIAIIAFPPILKQIKGTKSKIDKTTEILITTGAGNYIDENKNDFPKIHGNKYCITLQTLVDDNKVSKDLVDSEGNKLDLNKFVKVEVNKNSYNYSITDTCAGKYKEYILNGADPVLKEGMIPVTIDPDGTVKKADLTSEWYDYENKIWANAVTVSKTNRNTYESANAGIVIAEADILTYFVWIPRYRYKLWYVEAVDGDGGYTDPTKVHSIDIVFEGKNTAKSSGNQNGQYLTHPAFTFGDEELNGVWVGKFETGYNGLTSSTEEVASEESNKVIIKPNVYSWRGQILSQAYATALGINDADNVFGLNNDSDTHVMKNIEWGAVAYLSHSKYGKDSEVYGNNNSDYLTGCGGDGASADSSSSCLNAYGVKTDNIYNQSTTGNISGIFDMSGGAWESVMAYTTEDAYEYKYSGFTAETFPEAKYIDVYSSYDNLDFSKRILGDATGEMGPFKVNSDPNPNRYASSSWYEDNANTPSHASPWVVRGGNGIANQISAGIFYFSTSFGDKSGSGAGDRQNLRGSITFRVVIA